MANIKKLEQGRASKAYEFALAGSQIEKKKEYKSYVKKIPMLIKTNGLGATLAFMKAKGGTYELIYNHIYEWLKKDNKFGIFNPQQKEDLVAKIVDLESPLYRAVTNEVLSFMMWLCRFADGLIED